MQHWTWVQDLLGPQQLKGKSFYLDCVKRRHSALLVEAIAHLGGNVESFLNKDVNIVISGSQEAWQECQPKAARIVAGGTKGPCSPVSTHHRQSQDSTSSQRSATPKPSVCGSRGKALLEKAISNNERCLGSSVLANARLWGVKIVHVDNFLLYIERLTVATARGKNRKVEKKAGGSSAPKVVKAGGLKLPYLKIEDSSRKYRPLHLQSVVFPTLDYTGRFSPFEPPAPPPPENEKDQGNHRTRERSADPSTSQGKLPAPLPLTPSLRRARKKTVGFCECCQLAFKEQDEHLKSDQHRGFVQDSSHYSVVDQLVVLMEPGFADSPIESPATMRLPSPPGLPLDSSLDLDHQAHSETEKAIQALLTQDSPPRFSPHPDQGTVADSVPPAALTSPTPASGHLPPGHQRIHSKTGWACRAEDGGTDLKQEKPPVESSWTTPSSRTPEPTEMDRTGSRTLCHPMPSPGPNHRKRSRASSLSPRASKRRRTSWQPTSDPTVAHPSISQNRRAPRFTPNPTHPTHEPPLLPVPPLVPAFCMSQSDAPRITEPRQEVESGEKLCVAALTELSNRPCRLGPSPHGHLALPGCSDGNSATLSVSHQHKGTEPLPWELPDIESPLVTVHPPVMDLPQLPPTSLQDSLEASDPFTALSTCPHPPRTPQGFTPLTALPCPTVAPCCPLASQDSDAALSQSFSSVFIESGLLPDPSAYSPSSSESDWDCGLLSRLIPAVPPPAKGERCLLDLDLLQRPCAGMQDKSYESRLCSVLHPPTPPPSLCGEDTDPAFFTRTIDHCLEACVIQEVGINM